MLIKSTIIVDGDSEVWMWESKIEFGGAAVRVKLKYERFKWGMGWWKGLFSQPFLFQIHHTARTAETVEW